MKKYIFDLDGTLLNAHWNEEDEFFRSILPIDQAIKFEDERVDLIYGYEENYPRYDIYNLSRWFMDHGYNINTSKINEWIHFNGDIMGNDMCDGVIELLEDIKSRDGEIVLLSNWFNYTQINRLKRSGLYEYFDDFVTGDMELKPYLESYRLAASFTPFNECMMIGDNYVKDYYKPLMYGMNAYFVDENHGLRELIGGDANDRRCKTKIKTRFE